MGADLLLKINKHFFYYIYSKLELNLSPYGSQYPQKDKLVSNVTRKNKNKNFDKQFSAIQNASVFTSIAALHFNVIPNKIRSHI